jgi:hypothetical protein
LVEATISQVSGALEVSQVEPLVDEATDPSDVSTLSDRVIAPLGLIATVSAQTAAPVPTVQPGPVAAEEPMQVGPAVGDQPNAEPTVSAEQNTKPPNAGAQAVDTSNVQSRIAEQRAGDQRAADQRTGDQHLSAQPLGERLPSVGRVSAEMLDIHDAVPLQPSIASTIRTRAQLELLPPAQASSSVEPVSAADGPAGSSFEIPLAPLAVSTSTSNSTQRPLGDQPRLPMTALPASTASSSSTSSMTGSLPSSISTLAMADIWHVMRRHSPRAPSVIVLPNLAPPG